MSGIAIDYFVNSAYQLNQKAQKLLFAVNKEHSKDSIAFFYPKNLFSTAEGDEEEIIILSKNKKIWRASCVENSYIYKFEVWDIKEIAKLELYPDSERESVELRIILRDNTELVLNSEKDGNIHWAYRYREHIKEMFATLST
ncbi:hypothetical protein MKX41_09760 [Paenibacillus sp. FSL R5-0475]|uniref:hypothetical protein n=1 Tax=Paenibacillus sp. FSL R5-0475 TaxID=2921643 RepID=UPI0030F87718